MTSAQSDEASGIKTVTIGLYVATIGIIFEETIKKYIVNQKEQVKKNLEEPLCSGVSKKLAIGVSWQ